LIAWLLGQVELIEWLIARRRAGWIDWLIARLLGEEWDWLIDWLIGEGRVEADYRTAANHHHNPTEGTDETGRAGVEIDDEYQRKY